MINKVITVQFNFASDCSCNHSEDEMIEIAKVNIENFLLQSGIESEMNSWGITNFEINNP